jgi:peptidoglycan/xylan/chitin deacetylase (PgdA/CDA1 family)
MMGESFHQDISEIERCEDEIEKVCGERTHLFRPPKGLWDGDTFLAAADLGYRIVLWSVALEHHTAKTPRAMADRVLGKVRPGMIILAHDGEPSHPVNRDLTMKALPLLMDGLRRKGYRMVTIPELIRIDRQGRRTGQAKDEVEGRSARRWSILSPRFVSQSLTSCAQKK